LRDDLTDISVPVHYLTHGKAISQQLPAVKRCSSINRSLPIAIGTRETRGPWRGNEQGIRELGQKDRDAVIQPRFARGRGHSLAHALPCTLNDELSVRNDECAQHEAPLLPQSGRGAMLSRRGFIVFEDAGERPPHLRQLRQLHHEVAFLCSPRPSSSSALLLAILEGQQERVP